MAMWTVTFGDSHSRSANVSAAGHGWEYLGNVSTTTAPVVAYSCGEGTVLDDTNTTCVGTCSDNLLVISALGVTVAVLGLAIGAAFLAGRAMGMKEGSDYPGALQIVRGNANEVQHSSQPKKQRPSSVGSSEDMPLYEDDTDADTPRKYNFSGSSGT
jgi:hypothetical protein